MGGTNTDGRIVGEGHVFNRTTCMYWAKGKDERCEAGVVYQQRRVRPGVITKSLPCFKESGLSNCSYQKFPTEEQAAAQEVEDHAHAVKWLVNIVSDICPICEKPITAKKQAGRGVYAEPCGHRLYQGKI